MNIAESFSTYMQSLSLGTFGTDIYIGSVPLDAPNTCWWIISSGGSPVQKNHTAEVMKQYNLDVYYRSTDSESLYNTLHDFEVTLNNPNCTQLTDFDTIEIQAISFPADQDIDNEDRTVGLLQVTIRTYYKE